MPAHIAAAGQVDCVQARARRLRKAALGLLAVALGAVCVPHGAHAADVCLIQIPGAGPLHPPPQFTAALKAIARCPKRDILHVTIANGIGVELLSGIAAAYCAFDHVIVTDHEEDGVGLSCVYAGQRSLRRIYPPE